ncbi:MAG: DHH family phosphoesterase [Oscillospiraceae bacterium]|nr:DHH family phosphoesterase [Oscillospiraceae bacterium]
MSSLTRNETAQWLKDHDHYLILTHRRPDGDTIGSAAVLCRGLRQLGKKAHVLYNGEITQKYAPLHQGLSKKTAAAGDTVICVDVASANMLPDSFRKLQERIELRIDHHGTATPFTPLELVDPQAGACADIIYDILCLLGIKLDQPMAEALYTAVSTDTGCFRYANTNAHSYLVAAACAEAGGDLYAINQAVFETNTLAKLRLQGWMVENTRFLAEGRIAVCALPLAMEQHFGVTEDDMENVSGFPRSIEGVKIAATLRQTGHGQVKMSVRAVPGYDAAAVCALFGGGGHKGAAGATIELSLEEAAAAVAKAMLELEKKS